MWLDWVDQGERRVLQKERGLGFGTPPVQVVISPAYPLNHNDDDDDDDDDRDQ